jgi:hypothetical protein
MRKGETESLFPSLNSCSICLRLFSLSLLFKVYSLGTVNDISSTKNSPEVRLQSYAIIQLAFLVTGKLVILAFSRQKRSVSYDPFSCDWPTPYDHSRFPYVGENHEPIFCGAYVVEMYVS